MESSCYCYLGLIQSFGILGQLLKIHPFVHPKKNSIVQGLEEVPKFNLIFKATKHSLEAFCIWPFRTTPYKMILSVHFFKTLGVLGFKFNPTLIRLVYWNFCRSQTVAIAGLEKILITPKGVTAALLGVIWLEWIKYYMWGLSCSFGGGQLSCIKKHCLGYSCILRGASSLFQ